MGVQAWSNDDSQISNAKRLLKVKSNTSMHHAITNMIELSDKQNKCTFGHRPTRHSDHNIQLQQLLLCSRCPNNHGSDPSKVITPKRPLSPKHGLRMPKKMLGACCMMSALFDLMTSHGGYRAYSPIT